MLLSWMASSVGDAVDDEDGGARRKFGVGVGSLLADTLQLERVLVVARFYQKSILTSTSLLSENKTCTCLKGGIS